MARKQKIGLESSATRTALLDAAEAMMREEGYAAVTSRRLGARAGIRAQLVHYYFPSMDDLFITLYRRRAESGLCQAEAILASPTPLDMLWAQSADATDVALSLEFMALGNHRKAVRAETAAHGETLRRMQLEALTRHFAAQGITPRIPPGAILMILASTGFLLMLEAEAGMSTGHEDTRAFLLAAIHALQETGELPAR